MIKLTANEALTYCLSTQPVEFAVYTSETAGTIRLLDGSTELHVFTVGQTNKVTLTLAQGEHEVTAVHSGGESTNILRVSIGA